MKQILKKSIALTVLITICFMMMTAFMTSEVQAASKTHLKKSTITISVGNSYSQKLLTASGKSISSSKITWTSSNKSVATVSSKGVIKAKEVGKVTIKATYKGKTYKCKCTVGDLMKQLPKVSKAFKDGTTYFNKSVKYLTDWKLESSLRAASLAADNLEIAMEKCGSYNELADLKSQLKSAMLQLRNAVKTANKQSEVNAYSTLISKFSSLSYTLEDINEEMKAVLAKYLE